MQWKLSWQESRNSSFSAVSDLSVLSEPRAQPISPLLDTALASHVFIIPFHYVSWCAFWVISVFLIPIFSFYYHFHCDSLIHSAPRPLRHLSSPFSLHYFHYTDFSTSLPPFTSPFLNFVSFRSLFTAAIVLCWIPDASLLCSLSWLNRDEYASEHTVSSPNTLGSCQWHLLSQVGTAWDTVDEKGKENRDTDVKIISQWRKEKQGKKWCPRIKCKHITKACWKEKWLSKCWQHKLTTK